MKNVNNKKRNERPCKRTEIENREEVSKSNDDNIKINDSRKIREFIRKNIVTQE